ncbi:CDP-glycerol glycerophosphotransferase family protein, partial [Lactobacillus parabuchneri]|nr:CDP-glycerol glycerophosphotransferase family protein [Lentilactobacillus parabuchneri]
GGLVQSKRTKIVQIWHADGAIKKFGWEDPTTESRSRSDKRRFQQVYDHFDEYIVGSKAMGNVFVNSYHENFDRIKLLGYPRSDQYLSAEWQTNA